MRSLAGRDLISIEDLTKGEIEKILDDADRMRGEPHPTLCRGAIPRALKKCEKCQGGALQFEPGEAGAEAAKLKKFSDAGGSQIQWLPDAGRFTLFERPRYILASCFFEPSTRTRLSFEAAMVRLGGACIGFADAAGTSSAKGETLSDSMRVISAYCDVLVIRHPAEGSAQIAAGVSDVPVINAGDGSNQHPTQTLIDLFSIRECQQSLSNLSIAIAGDLKYGRTVHSLILGLLHYSPRLYFISSGAFQLPSSFANTLRAKGIHFSVHSNLDEVIPHVDILYMTRLQKERLSTGDASQHPARISASQLKGANPKLRILHPLPRVDEIDPAIDDTPHAYYFQQAKNGLYVRMALLANLLEKKI